MDAQPRPDAPQDPSAYVLTIEDALARYDGAGIPRLPRRIQKYYARGDLDCRKVETATGEKWFITAASLDRHIAYTKETIAKSGRVLPRPDTSEDAEPESQQLIL